MERDEFFVEKPFTSPWGTGDPWATSEQLDRDLVEAARRGPVMGYDEVGLAIGLVDLLHDELRRFGTDSSHKLDDKQISLVREAVEACLRRLGIEFALPFRDFERFRSYWIKKGASGGGGWQARRDILAEILEPLTDKLVRMEERSLDELAEPVSPRGATGWPAVDIEITELRRKFRSASTPQDYRAIGTHCVGVVEALSRMAYDPTRHLRDGESEPPVDKSKIRLDRVIEDALPGGSNEEIRGLAKRAVTVAHQVKHSTTPTRLEAGLASDAAILLANMLRRICDDQQD